MKMFANLLRCMFLIGAFLAPLSACATTPIEGQVLEYGSNKPIPGAIVLARWEKTYVSIGHSTTACVHAQTTSTDEKGRFSLPGYKGETPQFDLYAMGYERFLLKAASGSADLYVKSITGSKGERFQSLWRLFSATGCQAAGRSAKNLFPLYKAAYEESKPLADSKEERRLLQIMRELTASAWIAEDVSRTTTEEQKLIKEYLRDHLQ